MAELEDRKKILEIETAINNTLAAEIKNLSERNRLTGVGATLKQSQIDSIDAVTKSLTQASDAAIRSAGMNSSLASLA